MERLWRIRSIGAEHRGLVFAKQQAHADEFQILQSALLLVETCRQTSSENNIVRCGGKT